MCLCVCVWVAATPRFGFIEHSSSTAAALPVHDDPRNTNEVKHLCRELQSEGQARICCPHPLPPPPPPPLQHAPATLHSYNELQLQVVRPVCASASWGQLLKTAQRVFSVRFCSVCFTLGWGPRQTRRTIFRVLFAPLAQSCSLPLSLSRSIFLSVSLSLFWSFYFVAPAQPRHDF